MAKTRTGNNTPSSAGSSQLSRQNTGTSSPVRTKSNPRGLTANELVVGTSKAISVVCRIRPMNQRERKEQGEPVVFVDGNGSSVDVGKGDGKLSFDFDASLGMEGSQLDVYNAAAAQIVDDFCRGYNGTVFAYGQTGSGKTYTMEGIVGDATRRGIVPRMIEAIFEHTAQAPHWMEFKTHVQMMEIYNEKIRDLLSPDNLKENLRLREDRAGAVYVEGLVARTVSDEAQVQELMETGASCRSTAETVMNEASSRSHSIFIITLEQTNMTDGVYKKSKLFMVDLAGSEMVYKTGAQGTTLVEAQHINKSLLQLNKVILALSEGRASHIPYRDSKLTRLLQDAIGGNCRTSLIICCSPASTHEAETLSTMRFGKSAKRIENRARINKEQNPAEMRHMLEEMRKKNEELLNIINAKDFKIETLKSVAGEAPKTQANKKEPPDVQSALKMVELKEEIVHEMEKRKKLEGKMQALEQMIAETEQEHEDEMDDMRGEVDRLQTVVAEKERELETQQVDMLLTSGKFNKGADKSGKAVQKLISEISKVESAAASVLGDGATEDNQARALLDKIRGLSKMVKTIATSDDDKEREKEKKKGPPKDDLKISTESSTSSSGLKLPQITSPGSNDGGDGGGAGKGGRKMSQRRMMMAGWRVIYT